MAARMPTSDSTVSEHTTLGDAAVPPVTSWWQLSPDKVSTIASHAAGAIVILVITWLVAKWTKRALAKAFQKTDLDETLERFIANSAGWVVMALGILAALATAGVEVTAFVAIFSTMGLAIGLAMQGALSHVASGVMLLIQRPFSVGDSVNIAGREGTVDSIDLFTTSIDTPDNRRVIIPNGAIFGTVIENHSHHGKRLCQIKVSLAPSADHERARSLLVQTAHAVIAKEIGAMADPAPSAVLLDVGAAQTWRVNVWVETKKLIAVQEALIGESDRRIAAAGLSAPAAQRVQTVAGV